MLYAELGPAQLPFPAPVRSPRLLPGSAARPPQFAECAAIGGRTQQARPAAGSRCSCGAGGHGARAPAGAGERPGAPGRGRRERPSGNARPAAARRTGGGRGAGAASANGGAVGIRKGWPRRWHWLGRQHCAQCCIRVLCCHVIFRQNANFTERR